MLWDRIIFKEKLKILIPCDTFCIWMFIINWSLFLTPWIPKLCRVKTMSGGWTGPVGQRLANLIYSDVPVIEEKGFVQDRGIGEVQSWEKSASPEAFCSSHLLTYLQEDLCSGHSDVRVVLTDITPALNELTVWWSDRQTNNYIPWRMCNKQVATWCRGSQSEQVCFVRRRSDMGWRVGDGSPNKVMLELGIYS